MTHFAPFGSIILDYIFPNDYLIGGTIDFYNYGMVDFEWGKTKEDSKLKLTIYDIENNLRIQREIEYKELIYNTNHKDNYQCEIDLTSRLKPLKHYINYYKSNPKVVMGYLLLFMFLFFILKTVLFVFKLVFKIVTFPFRLCFRKKENKVEIDSKKKNQ